MTSDRAGSLPCSRRPGGRSHAAACAEGETIHDVPFPVDEATVDGMLAADAFGHERRALLEGARPLPEVAE